MHTTTNKPTAARVSGNPTRLALTPDQPGFNDASPLRSERGVTAAPGFMARLWCWCCDAGEWLYLAPVCTYVALVWLIAGVVGLVVACAISVVVAVPLFLWWMFRPEPHWMDVDDE